MSYAPDTPEPMVTVGPHLLAIRGYVYDKSPSPAGVVGWSLAPPPCEADFNRTVRPSMRMYTPPPEFAVNGDAGRPELAALITSAIGIITQPHSTKDVEGETIAGRIADRFGSGDQWYDADDVHIEDILVAADGDHQACGDIHLWILPDASSILVLAGWWDLGPLFPDPRPDGYFAGLCNELSELEPVDLGELYETYASPNCGLVAFRVHSDPDRWRRKYLQDSEEWSRQLGRWLDMAGGRPLECELREHVEMFADTLRPQHLARLLASDSHEVREWALTLAHRIQSEDP